VRYERLSYSSSIRCLDRDKTYHEEQGEPENVNFALPPLVAKLVKCFYFSPETWSVDDSEQPSYACEVAIDEVRRDFPAR
jgi:hypothetical protein